MTATFFRYQPTWSSLQNYSVPQWFQDAKLGIFIHWGLYSVPAYDNEWYSRQMYLPGHPVYEHHRQKWGHQSQFGYKDFIPLFKAEQFDPDAWIALFKQAGARYVVPVAEHHDGFAMYDSALTEWNAARMGPERDVIGELARAARQQGLTFGLSSHRAEHWWFFDGGRQFDSDVQDERYASFYGPAAPASPSAIPGAAWHNRDWTPRPNALFLDDWLARCCELVDRYQPQLIYFDGWVEQIVFEPYLQKFAAYYYNRALDWDQGVVLCNKFEAFPKGAGVYDLERGKLNRIREDYWQTDTTMTQKSWCYIEDDDYKSVTTLVHTLVDAVSKNGNLLLNVGPKADGTIPDEAANILMELGKWLRLNGEAIYDTRHWHSFGEGATQVNEGHKQEGSDKPFTPEDIRFTTRDNNLYAVCLGWPGTSATIRSLGSASPIPADKIEAIHLLGCDEPLTWSQCADGLTIHTPDQPPGDHAFTFRISLKTAP